MKLRLLLLASPLFFISGCVSQILNSEEISITRTAPQVAEGEEAPEDTNEVWKIALASVKNLSPTRYTVVVLDKPEGGEWQFSGVSSVRNTANLNLVPGQREALLINRKEFIVAPLWDYGGLPNEEPFVCKVVGLASETAVKGVSPCNSDFASFTVIDSVVNNALSVATLTATQSKIVDRDEIERILAGDILQKIDAAEQDCAKTEAELKAYASKIKVDTKIDNQSGFDALENIAQIEVQTPKYFCGDDINKFSYKLVAPNDRGADYAFKVSGLPEEGVKYAPDVLPEPISATLRVTGRRYSSVKPEFVYENKDLVFTIVEMMPRGRYRAPIVVKVKAENRLNDYVTMSAITLNINGYQYSVVGTGQGATIGPKQTRELSLKFNNIDYAVLRRLQGVATKSELERNQVRVAADVSYVVNAEQRSVSGTLGKAVADML